MDLYGANGHGAVQKHPRSIEHAVPCELMDHVQHIVAAADRIDGHQDGPPYRQRLGDDVPKKRTRQDGESVVTLS
jgi:hypothetical protein